MFSLVSIAHAANTVDTTVFASVIDPIISNILDPIILLMFAVALIMFVWGVIQMFMNGGDAEARSNGQRHMLWGIIGLFIMTSAWGIIYFISNTIKAH